MLSADYKVINPTTKHIASNNGFTIAQTGGWYDVYFNGVHIVGSLDIVVVFRYIL